MDSFFINDLIAVRATQRAVIEQLALRVEQEELWRDRRSKTPGHRAVRIAVDREYDAPVLLEGPQFLRGLLRTRHHPDEKDFAGAVALVCRNDFFNLRFRLRASGGKKHHHGAHPLAVVIHHPLNVFQIE
jgi:hypothetical protein